MKTPTNENGAEPGSHRAEKTDTSTVAAHQPTVNTENTENADAVALLRQIAGTLAAIRQLQSEQLDAQ